MDFPVGVKQAFANGKADASLSKLTDFLNIAVKAMDDPSLLGLMLFMKP